MNTTYETIDAAIADAGNTGYRIFRLGKRIVAVHSVAITCHLLQGRQGEYVWRDMRQVIALDLVSV